MTTRSPSTRVTQPQRGAAYPREGWSLAVLTVGFVPASAGLFVGWSQGEGKEPFVAGISLGTIALLVGGWLTLTSMRWSISQKMLALLAVPIPFCAGLIVVAHAVTRFTMQDEDAEYVAPLAIALLWIGFLLLFIIPAAAAAYLARAARIASLGRS